MPRRAHYDPVECSFRLQVLYRAEANQGRAAATAENHVLSACHLIRVDQVGRAPRINTGFKSDKAVKDSVLIVNHKISGFVPKPPNAAPSEPPSNPPA